MKIEELVISQNYSLIRTSNKDFYISKKICTRVIT